MTYYIFAYWHEPDWKKFAGATVKIFDLAHNLSELGNNVILFLPKYEFGKMDSGFRIIEVPFLNLPLMRSFSFNIMLILKLISLLAVGCKPHIVYVRRMGSVVPGLYSKIVKALFFYEINDDPYAINYHSGALFWFEIRRFISKMQDDINIQFCDRAFVITKDIINKIHENKRSVNSRKFIELPSGANCELFKPMDINKCRKRLNIEIETKCICFAGSLLKHQGIDKLILAAPLILKTNPSLKIFIIGEGPMKNEWVESATKKGLSKTFIFTGQVDYEDMPVWINAMDICVAPFLENAGYRSPVKLFDYLSCGKPVVASLVHGNTDIFKASGAIKYVEPSNSIQLAEEVTKLLKDPELSEKMGKAGRRFIKKRFDRKHNAQIVDKTVSALYETM